MSKNNIGYDKRDYKYHDFVNYAEEKHEQRECKKKNLNKLMVLTEDIHDIISECRNEMAVPVFDDPEFTYDQIREYLKTLDIL